MRNKSFKRVIASSLIVVMNILLVNSAFAWSSNNWNDVSDNNSGTGHKSLILSIDSGLFSKGTGIAARNQRLTAEAARLTDKGRMSASYDTSSPYHAKTYYDMADVISIASFLYNLANRSLLGNYLNTNLEDYSNNTHKRIVSDLAFLMSDINIPIESAYDQGYVILGVYCHLLEDIYAHRAIFTDTRISSINTAYLKDYTLESFKKVIGNGIAMIRLKDYLQDSNLTFITDSGKKYSGLTDTEAYEDNPFFWSERYQIARSATINQINNIMRGSSFSFSNLGLSLK